MRGAQPWQHPVRASLDEDLIGRLEAGAPWGHRVWEASTVAVVLGRATAASEVCAEACTADRVPVLRRRGGGGGVVLGPGCIILSVAAHVERELDVGGYLDRIATFLAETLAALTGLPLEPQGSGDLCLGDRKVLGSSLFRRRRLLFYQASLLHSLDLALVERYLSHPAREPAYRRGRPHRAFLTNLEAAGSACPIGELCEGLDRRLPVLSGRLG